MRFETWLGATTPSLPLRRLRDIFLVAEPPLLRKEGNAHHLKALVAAAGRAMSLCLCGECRTSGREPFAEEKSDITDAVSIRLELLFAEPVGVVDENLPEPDRPISNGFDLD